MKIKSIECFILADKLKETFYFSQWEYSERRICVVKVTSDSGHVGWGEGYGPAGLIKAGIEFLTPHVVGMNPLQTETIWSVMYRRTLDFARRGVLVAAISAIDVALWDLKGKILEQPVHQLLGGKKRDTIVPYATGMYFTEGGVMADKLCKEALEYVNLGYKAMKMKVGLTLEEDIENVKKLRETIGPDVKLMIDSNHAYNLREAVQLANAVEKYDISWFEEPISPEYYDQYAELRTKTTIPISGGECEYLRFGFQTLLQSKSVDIIQPDICATGGLTEAKRIGTLATVYGVEVVPHTWGTGIAFAAALHFISNLDCMPGRLRSPECYIEHDRTENPLREQLTTSDMVFDKGLIKVSDKPGLGFTLNEDALYKFALKE
ncbi:mandelate racemase/muconate lactonizing enzyme family protein [Flavobacterium algicola]|uniref:mandelate racemase/muconate lactonizing enzyme family protein n=1 Tax=Flavobacterium algicola TaxID=556529 RepID=UPI001EFEA932|nr:mandelate racemase/muconate lactonizing enzyme family protein [Flavobacterium algicola]MCG9793715.1 mandelate racemase/muconate lactonizing enzyme family protein [Flavobacterium algicola]